jgi:hypothetical protein
MDASSRIPSSVTTFAPVKIMTASLLLDVSDRIL